MMAGMNILCASRGWNVDKRRFRAGRENCPQRRASSPQVSLRQKNAQAAAAKEVFGLSRISAALIYYY
jgi:hypothetical protein